MKSVLPLVVLCWTTVLAAEPRSETAELYGQVLGAQGKPVADSELLLIAPTVSPYRGFAFGAAIDQTQPAVTSSTKTDAEGNFRLRIDTSDPNWLRPGDGTLVAIGIDGAMSAVSYRQTRAFVDLPLEIQLPEPEKVSVQILDADAKPVAGASIAPARFAGASLPASVAKSFSVISDQRGVATLQVSPERLESIYAEGETIGTQLLSLSLGEKTMPAASAMRIQTIRLRAKQGTPNATETLPKIEWLLVTVRGQNEPLECVWQTVQTHGGESIEVGHVGSGKMVLVSDAHRGHGYFANPNDVQIEAGQTEVVVSVKRGVHLSGRVQSLVDARPLAGITLDVTGLSYQHVVSQTDGSFQAWIEELVYSVYPRDPLQRYYNSESFYTRPNPEHSPGEAIVVTFELTPVAGNVGRVVNEDGHPMAGVTVRCAYKRERFSNQEQLLTDRRGEFRFANVGEGTPVELTVFDKQGVTNQPLQLTLTPDAAPVLRLSPAKPIRLSGRIVDAAGQGVVGARVQVMRGTVSIPARFNGTEYSATDALADRNDRIVTDADGRFESPQLVDWKHHHALTIRHADYHERRTSQRPIELESESATGFDFGTISLRPIAGDSTLSVSVKDHLGQLIPNARVVVIQPRQSNATAITDDAGVATLAIRLAGGVLAVAHRREGTFFQTLTGTETRLDVVLAGPGTAIPPLAWPDHSLETRSSAARRVLETFGPMDGFDVETATDGEICDVAGALAFVDPPTFLQTATATKSKLEKRGGIGESIAQKAASRNDALSLMVLPMMPSQMRAYLLLQRARDADQADERNKWLAQAIAEARKLTGDEAATSFGRIAMLLLEAGDVETATTLIRDIYDSQNEHQAALNSPLQEPARSKRGVARYFYPQTALLDLPKAMKLIHLHAYPHEIENLQSLAALIAVGAGKSDWETAMSLLQRDSFAGIEWSLVPGRFGDTPLPTAAFVNELASRLPAPVAKGMLLVCGALNVPDATDAQRRELLHAAADLLWQSRDHDPEFYSTSLAYMLSDKIASIAKIDSALARQLAFECLWDLHRVRDERYGYPDRTFSPVAEALAGIDSSLGRAIVSPFFQDWTWMLRDYRTVYEVEPLVVAAKIDPEWAADVALRLMQGEFAHDRPRRTAVLDSLVTGLAETN